MSKGVGKMLTQETWDALLKAGVPESELLAEQPFGPIIFSYTRKQAIEDGVLIDVTRTATLCGFKVPVAVTCGLWAQLPPDADCPDDKTAALRLMLVCLWNGIRRQPRDNDRVHFKAGELAVWAQIGPGDEGEPVMTIMLEGED